MAKKKYSIIKDLVDTAASLPWYAGLLLALISYAGLHYAASLTASSGIPAGNAKGMAQGAGRMLLSTLATLLQYVVPLALVIGAVISFIQRRKDQALHAQVASSPNRHALHKMSWQDFERLVAESFRRRGYQTNIRGDGGG